MEQSVASLSSPSVEDHSPAACAQSPASINGPFQRWPEQLATPFSQCVPMLPIVDEEVSSSQYNDVVSPSMPAGHILARQSTQDMLSYFDEHLCDSLAICLPQLANPFRTLVLPLALKDTGILQALLGLATCHAQISVHNNVKVDPAAALEYKLAAIQSLSGLLIKEEVLGLTLHEEEATLATALLLILHDVCSRIPTAGRR